MSEIKVGDDLSSIISQIEGIIKTFEGLSSDMDSLTNGIGKTTKWEGDTREQEHAMCILTNKYQDDVKFLFESLRVHVTELEIARNSFESKSQAVRYLDW